MSSEDITSALENLSAIKAGKDPRKSAPTSPQREDALTVAEREVDRLYDEHDELAKELPRCNLNVGVARWDGRNGYCRYNTRFGGKRRFNKRITQTNHSPHQHIVVINEKIYEQGNVKGFLDTVRHEVAHAVVYEIHGSSQSHNHNWKAMATKLGADASSCHNKRDRSDEYKYYVGCPNCGMTSGKTKRSKSIKQPFSRRCLDCGENTLVSFDSGDEMPSENGTVAVESIPWDNRAEWQEAGRP